MYTWMIRREGPVLFLCPEHEVNVLGSTSGRAAEQRLGLWGHGTGCTGPPLWALLLPSPAVLTLKSLPDVTVLQHWPQGPGRPTTVCERVVEEKRTGKRERRNKQNMSV